MSSPHPRHRWTTSFAPHWGQACSSSGKSSSQLGQWGIRRGSEMNGFVLPCPSGKNRAALQVLGPLRLFPAPPARAGLRFEDGRREGP